MSGERWWADGTAVKDENGLRVANCGRWQDALLCAAAPEMLDALRDLSASCQKWAPTIDRSRAAAAIRAAGGDE